MALSGSVAFDSSPRGTSLYVHVPFCVVKCGYCDFNSYVATDDGAHGRFLDAFAAELDRAWPKGTKRPVSVFVGGGTPSMLRVDELERLLSLLDEHVDLAACGEVSMEANPESFTVDKARVARAAGVNRLSIGVQSFHAHQLQFLDRAHDAEKAEQAVRSAREAGFENISMDMMFGVPGETLEQWQQDLERALCSDPDHLSCYNLTFEAGTRLEHARQKGTTIPNDPEVDRAQFEWTRHRLAQAGFTAYEVSNFAGRGGPCVHNDHYWLQGDYVGVGPGASSHRRGVRSTNLKALEAWVRAAQAGDPCAGEAETLRPLQRAAEALWLGIRRAQGVDVVEVEQRISVPVRARFAATIEQHVARGLVAYDGRWLRLVGEGLLLADQVGGDYLAIGVGK